MGPKHRKQVKGQVTVDPNSKPLIHTLLHPISWVLHRLHALLTTILLAVLALGPMPHHIGFVMDGNRRYARLRGQKVAKGHQQGSESLKRTLRLCLRLRIPVVSVYAFAIDNFNRPPEEVDAIMTLARDSLREICQEDGFLQQHGIRLRCIGRMDLLSPEMQAALREMEVATSANVNGVLNVCGPYASRDEMTTAVREGVADARAGVIEEDDLTSDELFDRLATSQSAADVSPLIEHPGQLDILIRTSDVKRLSDFMMWQCAEDTQIHFVKTYWPDFGFTDMLPILLGWQQKVWARQMGW